MSEVEVDGCVVKFVDDEGNRIICRGILIVEHPPESDILEKKQSKGESYLPDPIPKEYIIDVVTMKEIEPADIQYGKTDVCSISIPDIEDGCLKLVPKMMPNTRSDTSA